MTETVEEFRARAREWLAANAAALSATGPDHGSSTEIAQRAQAAVFDAGFAGIAWPAEYGGQGLSRTYERAFAEEAAASGLPNGVVFAIGLGMCGPVMLTLGTEEQKQRYIPKLLRGDEIWCQLFSEPGAGSDVAALQSSAVPDGEGWVLNGQKVWTSVAQVSSFGVVVARTDPEVPKHAGLSMFIVDMHAPGVTVRPLRQMNGGSEFNEVFFDDVRIPAGNLVGELNNGWHAATVMLMHERVSIGAGGKVRSPLSWASLRELALERGLDGDPLIRQRLADILVRERSVDLLGARIREKARAGQNPGPIGSSGKLASAMLLADAADLAIDIAGPDAIAWAPDSNGGVWSKMLLSAPGVWIAGGTVDIQRNIIGERILGLPREPRVDKHLPFRELKVGTQGQEGA